MVGSPPGGEELMAAVLRVVATALGIVALGLVSLVMGIVRAGRMGVVHLYSRPGHEGVERDERGAVTLVELVVVTVLASIVLAAVAAVAAVAGRSAAMVSSSYGAQRRANAALSSAMSSVPDASPLHGCSLTSAGVVEQGVPAVFSTPLSSCAQITAVGAPVEAASSTAGGPQGLCWYAYPSSGTGLVPPDLQCLVSFPDHEVWSFDWPAQNCTYTSCSPPNGGNTNSSFPGAPAAGSLPSAPGAGATYAGQTASAQPFTFIGANGSVLSGTITPSQVYEVVVHVDESYGGGTSRGSKTYTYKDFVGSGAQGGSGSWQGI